MGRLVSLGVLALVLSVAGCDTDQPLTIDIQGAEVAITAGGAQVSEYQIWEVFEDDGLGNAMDFNGDGTAGDTSLWCLLTTTAGSPGSVPWTYSLDISVLRAGQTTPERLTSDSAATADFNRAPYDPDVGTTGLVLGNYGPLTLQHLNGRCSGNPGLVCNPGGSGRVCDDNGAGFCEHYFTCTDDLDESDACDPFNFGQCGGNGPCTPQGFCVGDGSACEPNCEELGLGDCVQNTVDRTFSFRSNSREKRTAASLKVLEAGPNMVAVTCDGDFSCENEVITFQINNSQGFVLPPLGICPPQPPTNFGPAALDPGTADASPDPNRFGFTLNKGDTVIVEAARSNDVPGSGILIDFAQAPGLDVKLFLCAQTPCTAENRIQVDDVVGEDSGTSVSFSFTAN